jgi:Domain of unknown function (DUF4169)
MGEVVNLRLARKRAQRRDEADKADANRTAFGLPKALRDKAGIENRRAERALDGARRFADPADKNASDENAGGLSPPPTDDAG